MSTKGLDLNTTLLPHGFEDILPPDAEQEARAIHHLMECFYGFGYDRVKPPLLEFEDSLFAPGPGEALLNNTFRVMDPVSHKMMGLRADITAQIARISSSRLKAQPRPLRLAYANDVLRTQASQHRTLRQFCQVGCEIIGDADIGSDIEACVVSIIGLKKLGVKDITVDLVFPSIVRKILENLNLEAQNQKHIEDALEKRDLSAIKNLPTEVFDVLKALMEASGVAGDAMKALKAIKSDFISSDDIQHLAEFYEGVQAAIHDLGYDDVSLTIDALENKLFAYHNGVAFTVFAKNARGELGCGGRYEVTGAQIDSAEHATGFTLYMDTVRQVMPECEAPQIRNVGMSESWAKVLEMQEQGYRVKRGE